MYKMSGYHLSDYLYIMPDYDQKQYNIQKSSAEKMKKHTDSQFVMYQSIDTKEYMEEESWKRRARNS